MLAGEQAHLAVGDGAAKRISPEYGPFAAALDTSREAQDALAALLQGPDDRLWLVEPAVWPAPPGTRVVRTAKVLQLVADREDVTDAVADDEIVPLTEADAREMFALARLTEPGPWEVGTHRYGEFFGIRIDGKLVAMAGERMRPSADFAEVSGVCTHPDHRGQGYARLLISRVMASQRARGLISYLHSYDGNEAAIGLYKSLGFRPRSHMYVTILAST